MQVKKGPGVVKRLVIGTASLVAAVVLTVALFLILPIMQAISGEPPKALDLVEVEAVLEPPPPPPPEPEPEEPEPDEPEPPKLTEPSEPLDLSELEVALNPGFGGAGYEMKLDIMEQISGGAGDDDLDRIFSLDELDQRPRVVFQRPPRYPPELRRADRQGTVEIVFFVDTTGRVTNPRVVKSTDAAFEKPALEAVRQWRFEPGTRQGERVQFKMKIPITFNPTG